MSVAIRQQATDPVAPDSWLDALTKLIPGEAIAALTGALQLDSVAASRSAQLALLLALTPLCPLVLFHSARRAGVEVHPLQYVVRTAVFTLYALAASPALTTWLDATRWITGVGAFVIALLASLVIAPR